MKQQIIYTIIFALLIFSQFVSAGSITDTYVSGDTLTATKMDSIKAAVNDNDGDINTNTINTGINTSDIASHETRISDLETVSTYTGVTFVNNVANKLINGTEAIYETLNITAPVAGYIVVHAHGNRQCSTNTSVFYALLKNTTTSEGSNTRSTEANVNIWSAYNTSFVFTVDAGLNSIELRAECSSATANGSIYITTMYGIFVPSI